MSALIWQELWCQSKKEKKPIVEIKRDEKAYAVIRTLNKQGRQGENTIFDCGELGLLEVSWAGSWKAKWLTVSKEFR